VKWIEQWWSPSRERNSFIERVLFFYESFFYEIPSLNVFSSFMIYESSLQPITWNKLYASNASPENSSPKKVLRKDRSIFNSKKWSCHRRNAGRRTKFSPVKSLDSSEFSSEFSDLNTLKSNVKVNPVISWNGQNSFHRIFPSNSQDFTTPQISFEFLEFYYTSNSFLIKPNNTNDRKTRPFPEILS